MTAPTHMVQLPGRPPVPVRVLSHTSTVRTGWKQVERTDGYAWDKLGHTVTSVQARYVKPMVSDFETMDEALALRPDLFEEMPDDVRDLLDTTTPEDDDAEPVDPAHDHDTDWMQ